MEMRDRRSSPEWSRTRPHLFGILERTNGLGLELLSVEILSKEVIERDLEPMP
jgi:hypothetical protein